MPMILALAVKLDILLITGDLSTQISLSLKILNP